MAARPGTTTAHPMALRAQKRREASIRLADAIKADMDPRDFRILAEAEGDDAPDFRFRVAGLTPLMHAASHGRIQLAEILLPLSKLRDMGAAGLNPLMWAAHEGHVDCVRLLAQHFDPAATTQSGDLTALCLAAEEGRLECVKELLLIQPPAADSLFAHLAITRARMHGHFDCAAAILGYAPASFVIDSHGFIVRGQQADSSQLGAATREALRVEGAAFAERLGGRGYAPLFSLINQGIPAHGGAAEAYEALIAHSHALDLHRGSGRTAIMEAASMLNWTAVEALAAAPGMTIGLLREVVHFARHGDAVHGDATDQIPLAIGWLRAMEESLALSGVLAESGERGAATVSDEESEALESMSRSGRRAPRAL